MRRLSSIVLFAMLAFCTEQNRIFVHTEAMDDVARPDVGDDIEVLHVPTDGYTTQKPGFYAIHSLSDWLLMWSDARPDTNPPPPPQAIDFDQEMLFVATAPTDGAKRIEIRKVIGSNSGIHVYVVETLPGTTCPRKAAGPPPMDIVAFKSSPFDIHVHHDRVHADDCGPPPDAIATCRVAGSGTSGQNKITVRAGQTIDCDASASKPRTGNIVDRNWQLTSAPTGSITKLTVGNQGRGVTMAVDAWGTYVLSLQIRDEVRDGFTTATIDAPPPTDTIPIELQWASTDRNDETSMYPRVELHVVDSGDDCGPAAAKTWCEVHPVGAIQNAELKPDANKSYRVYVSYQDFRLRGAPVACVRTYPRGASRLICDEQQRQAGAVWELGTLDPVTRTFGDAKTQPPLVDAGAPAHDAGNHHR